MAARRTATSPALTILDAMADPSLFDPWFQGQSWAAWKAFLAALFGLPINKAALEIYRQHTRCTSVPGLPAREAWLVVGRRGGKSLIAALVSVFLACFRDYRKILAPGERGTVMVIAADRRQARVVFRYIAGFLDTVPMLTRMVESRTKETINLTNRVTIEVHTANFRAVRGYTVVAAICDEIAFWRSEESANPDTEILNGLRPGMATVPGALLLCISSPYARRGALWEVYRQHHGQDGDPILVWQADTRSMNPSVDEQVIAEAYAQDESAAAAEYGAQFRRDIQDFIPHEVLESLVVEGRRGLPPVSDLRYFAFCDPSGGSQDSMTLAIAHHENGRALLDLVLERRPPFSPEAVVKEFVATLKQYSINSVTGDRYGGEWPRERFREHGISYEPSEKTKSEIYGEVLPSLNSGKVELLDNARLLSQLRGLERRTSRSGRDTIDHSPGGHDDVANAAAGALMLALKRGAMVIRCPTGVGSESPSLWEVLGGFRSNYDF